MIEDVFGLIAMIFISFLMLLAMIGLTYYGLSIMYEHYKLNIKKKEEGK